METCRSRGNCLNGTSPSTERCWGLLFEHGLNLYKPQDVKQPARKGRLFT
jgi:hypothetical protein